jgi:hypothetical protein
MNVIRQFYLYIELFFVPLLAFFAFSGVLQTLQEFSGPTVVSSRAPMWLHTTAMFHGPRYPNRRGLIAPEFNRAGIPPPPPGQRVPLRLTLFALLISVFLVSPWLVRLYRTFMRSDEELLFGSVLVLGTLLPIFVIFF